MATIRRAHILLPQELVREIDAVVGPRKRSAFLVETARAEIRRRRVLKFLESDQPAWKDEDHPELAKGSAAWVRRQRKDGQTRYGKIEQHTGQKLRANGKTHPDGKARPGGKK